jgi:hypothetical protein
MKQRFIKIYIEETADSPEDLAGSLDIIAGLIRSGFTSGFTPDWSIDYEEVDDDEEEEPEESQYHFDEAEVDGLLKIFEGIVRPQHISKLKEFGYKQDIYYKTWCQKFFEKFAEKISYDTYYSNEEIDEILDDLVDRIGEYAGNQYNKDLAEWLASDEMRFYYLTEAMKNTNCDDGFELLAEAQYIELKEVAPIARKFVEWYFEFVIEP